MKMRFTDSGDLEILLEHKLERDIWSCIIADAEFLGNEWLSDSLSPTFDDPWFEEWQEWVQPEIQTTYTAQLNALKTQAHPKDKIIFVLNKNIPLWFGAVNQARHALEMVFLFSEEEIPEEEEKRAEYMQHWGQEKQAAFQRSHFYIWFQEILLEGMSSFAPWNRKKDNNISLSDPPDNNSPSDNEQGEDYTQQNLF